MGSTSNPIKNFSILVAGEAGAKAMGIITTIYLARVLGTEGFGYIGFVAALVGYFTLFANPGFETVGTREIAKGELPAASIISSIFIIRAVLVISAIILLGVVVFISPFSSIVRMMVLVQGGSLLLVPFMSQFFFRGTKDMAAVAFSRIIQSASYLALIFIFVRLPEDLIRVPVMFVVSMGLSILPLTIGMLREIPLRTLHVDRGAVRKIRHYTLHIGGAGLLVQIYVSFDTIMLGYMRTAQEVGVYAAAYKIITFLTLVPTLVFQAYLPVLSSPETSGAMTTALKRYQRILFLMGIPVGAIGVVAAPYVLAWTFGPAFLTGVLPFRILLISAMIIYFNIAFANPLLAWGKEKEYLLIVGTGAAVNIILNVLLIPGYGNVGAASSTLCAELAVCVMSLRMRKKLGIAFTAL